MYFLTGMFGSSCQLAEYKSAGGQVETVEPPTTAYEDVRLEFLLLGDSSGRDAVRIDNKPGWMSFDLATGKIVGTPNEGAKVYSSISIHITRDGKTTTVGPFDLKVLGDPLKKDAWHLANRGQTAFSTSGGVPGFDLNLSATIAAGFHGQGIKVAVSDSGTEDTHEDLSVNHEPTLSRNYNTGLAGNNYQGSSFDPQSDADTEPSHGTSVAGVILGVGWNGKGSRGVAPKAKFGAFNFIPAAKAKRGITETSYLNQASGNFDVFNQSWGSGGAYFPDDGTYDLINSDYAAVQKTQVSSRRGGRGALYVRAAGNEFNYPSQGFVKDVCPAKPAPPAHFVDFPETNNYFTINSNLDADNTLPYAMVVGALSASGAKASYSSMGSDLWVSAPAGEFGDVAPATITVDRAGCKKGLASVPDVSAETPQSYIDALKRIFPFDTGQNALNSNCNYTNSFNGTSSAAPMTTGAVALLLSANPSLSWRDVKYIFAKTATKVEPAFNDKERAAKDFRFYRYSWTDSNVCGTLSFDPLNSSGIVANPASTAFLFRLSDPPGYVAVERWKANAAGFSFHNYYGFGRVNVDEAVKLAKNYVSPFTGKAFKTINIKNEALNLAIPNAGSVVNAQSCGAAYACLDVAINMPIALKIESVQVNVKIDVDGPLRNSSYPGELGIELISPSGTLSKLQLVNNAHMGAQLDDAQWGPSTPLEFVKVSGGVAHRHEIFQRFFEKVFPVSGFQMLSNAFFMEQAQGTWTLRLIDGTNSNFEYRWSAAVSNDVVTSQTNSFSAVNLKGRLKGYSIMFNGHDP